MVNIIDDDNWDPAPAMRLEDDLALRRLQEMLRATADDLRHLTSELNEHRAPKVQVKSQPIPLDDEFNEKVHIEELVNAKFYGHRIMEPSLNKTFTVAKSIPKLNNTAVQVNIDKKLPKAKKLVTTRTRIIEIDGNMDKNTKNRLNNKRLIKTAPPVISKEFVFKHEESQIKTTPLNKFKIQDMPSINIRSELKLQKVLQLDIVPDIKENTEDVTKQNNIAVMAAVHVETASKKEKKITLSTEGPPVKVPISKLTQTSCRDKKPIIKYSRMSTCESSGSLVSSDTKHNLKTQKQIKSVIRSSPRPLSRNRSKIKKTNVNKNDREQRARLRLEEWKRRLNEIYGKPSTSNYRESRSARKVPKQSNLSSAKPENILLNNAEYIPYSKLTLGGARVSDIEKEISNIPNKSDMPLSPILDKILSSRENSFYKESPRKSKKSPRILTTSDENLLQEVIDIEKKVSKIDKTIKKKINEPEPVHVSVSTESKDDDKDSYADDFEEDKSEDSKESNKESNDSKSEKENQNDNNSDDEYDNGEDKYTIENESNKCKKTDSKKIHLSIKNSVDVFEFVHSVDTQDNATQSNTTNRISLKETQTSPRNERINIQPIHNDLWSMDPRGEVNKMFELEKDLIKKLIIEEYGDLLQKNFTKASTSKDNVKETHKNVSALPKLTQTSPAHVKSVMTSPTRTKTRTTSPFLSLKVDHQTSPMVTVTNEEHVTVEVDGDEDGISINLSSPRFSLRLPQTSREILSNLDVASKSPMKTERNKDKTSINSNIAKPKKTNRKKYVTSSSSEIENSSDMTSLGEVKFNLKRRLKKKVFSVSESSESSSASKTSSDLPSGGIIPLRSEGEVSFSLRQTLRKVNDSNKISKSEGEASVGQTK